MTERKVKLVSFFFLQDLLDFVSTAVSPRMQVLECMYIRQTIDLLQVRSRSKTQ